MFSLNFSKTFDRSFSAIKDDAIRTEIWKKILQLEQRAPLVKKLKGNPYWSIHVNKFRIIYEMKGDDIFLADILSRKRGYREI